MDKPSNLGTVLEEVRGRLGCTIWELTWQCGECGRTLQSQLFGGEIATDMQARARRGECLCSPCRERKNRAADAEVMRLMRLSRDPTGTW